MDSARAKPLVADTALVEAAFEQLARALDLSRREWLTHGSEPVQPSV